MIKLLFYFFLIYLAGWIKGIILCFVITKLYLILMLKLFKLEPFSAGDRLFVFKPEEEAYNLMGFITFDNIDSMDIDKLKQSLIERGIKQFKKLRSIWEYKFFDFWWKERSLEDCLTILNPFEERINTTRFDTIDDLITYSYEETKIKFDLFHELPYKFILIKNEDGIHRNILLIKFEHSLTDGLGFVGLLAALGENYNLKLFPPSMKKSPVTWTQFAIGILFLPYFVLYCAYRNFFGLSSGDTPFKSNLGISGIPVTAISQKFDFNLFAKVNKFLGITFNDMMMTAFSAAIKKYCKERYHRIPENVITITPVSNRGLPTQPQDVDITNNSSAIACDLKLLDDPVKDCKIISREFGKNVRNVPMYKVLKVLSDFLNLCMPYYVTNWVFKKASLNFDITFTNVALSKESMIYAGCEVTNIFPLMTPGITYVFVGIYSYNGSFRWTICLDKNLKMDPKVLIKYVEDQMDIFGAVDVSTDTTETNKMK